MTPAERAEDSRRCFDQALAALRAKLIAERQPGETADAYIRRVYPGSTLLAPR